jgi:hypothetical protein
MSAGTSVLRGIAYSIETGIETKFGPERTINKFIVFGVYRQ